MENPTKYRFDCGDGSKVPVDIDRGGEAVSGEERCVLVVDDEKDAVDLLVELIENEGFRAIGARNGQEALALLSRGLRPGLILLDLKMPVMDGWELTHVLYDDERFADIPIAIVTAAPPRTLPARRKDAGLFVKPIDVRRLLAKLQETCG